MKPLCNSILNIRNFSTREMLGLHCQQHCKFAMQGKTERIHQRAQRQLLFCATSMHEQMERNDTSAFPKRITREEETAHNGWRGCYGLGPALGPKGSSQISCCDRNT